MAALLEDILASLPEDATYAYTVRKLDDRFYVGFDEKIRLDVFASDVVMVTTWSGVMRMDAFAPDRYELVTYTIQDHLAEENDQVFYAGDIDGKILFRVPANLLKADVNYILLQEDDVVYITNEDEPSEYDEYVFSTMEKAFEGAAVYGTVVIQYWVQIGNRLYYLPENYEPGGYWLEVGFRKYHPKVIGAPECLDAEDYKVHVERNRITAMTPRYQLTTFFYGKVKTGEYFVNLPDLQDTKCSVLVIVPDLLEVEKDTRQQVKQVEQTESSAEELAEMILEYAGEEYVVEDKVTGALQYALSVLQSLSEPAEQEPEPVSLPIKETPVAKDNLFSGFDLGDF